MIKANIHRVCDRCSKAFDHIQFNVEDGLPEIPKPATITVMRGDYVVCRFVELCEDCDRVTGKHIDKLALIAKKKEDEPEPEPEANTEQEEPEASQNEPNEDPSIPQGEPAVAAESAHSF